MSLLGQYWTFTI